MSDKPAAEKTELATPKRQEDAEKKGQIPRSQEIQTVFVLGFGFMALFFTGSEAWDTLLNALRDSLGHLHDVSLNTDNITGFGLEKIRILGDVLWPVMIAVMVGGLLAGGMQTRFRATPEALQVKWERLSPLSGFKRIFSPQALVPTAMGAVKLAIVMGLTYGVVVDVVQDPIFYTSVDVVRIAEFLTGACYKIFLRVVLALILIAGLDYAYQVYRNNKELMMTKQEVKDEMKNTEGNPHVKAQQRKKRMGASQRQMLSQVPHADVVVTNPTHLAVAVRYDRGSMAAPKVVAKGSRLNALRIREIAKQHQVPILENKPLARLLFKHVRVGGEIPAQFYAAVAEVLAWVYRVNAYRYYRERQQ